MNAPRGVALAILLGAFGRATSALALGDAEAGKAVAERWCTSCHLVSDTAPQVATDAAPPFRAIATDPKNTPSSVYHFLQSPHAPMPNFELSLRDIDNLVAYFETLGLD